MSIKMKELPISERPYEKLELYGPERLSNSELLAIIIKTGTSKETAIGLAQQVLSLKQDNQKSLRFLQDISIQEFMEIKGIGKIKAIQIKAVCELAKRMSMPINNKRIKIKGTKDVVLLLDEELKFEKREIAKLIILNIKNEIMKIINVSMGGSNFAMIEPKDILTEPLKMNAPKIILIHNHPSGDCTPSQSDYIVTDKIFDAAEIMGIQLLDHIIIGDGKYQSILENRSTSYK